MTKHHKQHNHELAMRDNEKDRALEQARVLFDRLMSGSYEGYLRADHLTDAMWACLRTSGYALGMLDRTKSRTPEEIRETVASMTALLLDKVAFERLAQLQKPETEKTYADPGLIADEIIHLLDKSEKIHPVTDPDAVRCRRTAREAAFRAAAEQLAHRAEVAKNPVSKQAERLRTRAALCAARANKFTP